MDNDELRQRALALVTEIGCELVHKRRQATKVAIRAAYDTQVGEARRIYRAIRDGYDVRSYCEQLACILGGTDAHSLHRLFGPVVVDSLPGMPLPGER